MSTWQDNGLLVRWVQGGLYLEHRGIGLLLDAPVHVAEALSGEEKARLRCVCFSSGRARAVRGLISLMCDLEPHRAPKVPLRLRFLAGEERGPMLAEVWTRGWGRYTVSIDVERPGAKFEVGGMTVETHALPGGEPHWIPEPGVDRVTGLGFRVSVEDTTVVWAPGAAPTNVLRRLLKDASLAVVEIGAMPWPRSEQQWRLTLQDALGATASAAEVWIVTDEGRFAGDEA